MSAPIAPSAPYIGNPKIKKEIHSHGPVGFGIAVDDHFKEAYDECIKNGKSVMQFSFSNFVVSVQCVQSLIRNNPKCRFAIDGKIYEKPIWGTDNIKNYEYWNNIEKMPSTTIHTLLVKIG